jgi:hypothetical protein
MTKPSAEPEAQQKSICFVRGAAGSATGRIYRATGNSSFTDDPVTQYMPADSRSCQLECQPGMSWPWHGRPT